MKSKNHYLRPKTTWYKSLWFLALINGFGAINGGFVYTNNTLPDGDLRFLIFGLIGFINARILVYTLWHDDDKVPRQLSYYLVGTWTVWFLFLGASIGPGFFGCLFMPIALILTLSIVASGGWRRLTGIISGTVGALITVFIFNHIANRLGFFASSIPVGILMSMVGGSIYGLIFADTIKRDNRRQRRIQAEQIQGQKEKSRIPQRFSQEYPSDFNNNLTVGDDGELVEINKKETQPNKKRNS